MVNFLSSVGSRTDYQLAETTEVAAHMDIETGDDDLNNSTNSGGIENLLRASDMGGTPSLEELKCVAWLYHKLDFKKFIFQYFFHTTAIRGEPHLPRKKRLWVCSQ